MDMATDDLTDKVIGAAIEVHKRLGPGLLVADRIVVEIKSVNKLAPIRDARLLSCLKLAEKPLGLLMNFNVKLLRNGLRRLRNGHGG